jgi:predicted nucleic acid-binding protein
MTKRQVRVYADTSVFGGAFDQEFEEASRTFFDQIQAGRFQLVTSAVVSDEIKAAPVAVRKFFDDLRQVAEIADVSEGALKLQQAYLAAGIVGPKWEADALHVALATVAACGLIVSWNFKHIVNFEKIPLYNNVNQACGYPAIAIHSPQEVIVGEDEDKDI